MDYISQRLLAAGGDNNDPYYSSVRLLLPMDGANGWSTFTDRSPSPKSITVSGSVTTSTSNVHRGTASARFNGGGYLNFARQDFAGDFTIEGWVRLDNINQDQCMLSGDATNHQLFRFNNDGGPGRIMVYADGHVVPNANAALSGLSSGVYFHVACTRLGSYARLFVNGQLKAENSSFTAPIRFSRIGIGYQASAEPMVGNLDDFRATDVCRYTGNFTPPQDALPTQ